MLKVGIIGAGRLGTALAIGLTNKRAGICGIASRSDSSVDKLNEKLKTNFKNSFNDVVSNSDIIAITVPDVQIEGVAEQLSKEVSEENIKGKTFLHTSGSIDSDALITLRHKDAFTGSLHPIQTFSKADESWKGLDGIYYGFEGCAEAEDIAAKIVELFGGRMLTIDKNKKPLYHAACCIISNYTVTLSYIAEQLLETAGIEEDKAGESLKPLLSNTVENIKSLGSVDALTGPVSRGDTEVIGKHLNALKDISADEYEAYKNLAKITAKIALKKGIIDNMKYMEINETLNSK